jgi:putative chitinase
LTPELLAACTGGTVERARIFAAQLSAGMAMYMIDSPRRQAMFLANVGHESGGLVYTTEVWGPTAAQKRYEGTDLAKRLGNSQPGDGKRFRGHGLIQTTGRFNHAAVRDRLRQRFYDVPDFEADPLALTTAQWASLSACDYWDMKRLNAVADDGNFDAVCDLINRGRITEDVGDSNGWEDRLRRYTAACSALHITI